MEPTEKACTRCRQMQPLEKFSLMRGGKFGRNSVCRACKITEGRAAKASGRWPSFSSAGQRSYRLRHYYGIAVEQYAVLLASQKGTCALCGQPQNGGSGRVKELVVDHDHDGGHVRGLLCTPCNMWLGNYEEFVRRVGGVDAIAAYLAPKEAWIAPSYPEPKEPAFVKACRKCGIEKPLDDFTVNPGGYRKSRCKPCEAERVRAYYHENEQYRETVRARSRAQRRVVA